jgi:carboxyl-terminal processing protease
VRRGWASAACVVLAGAAWAGPITAEVKQEVLLSLQEVLTRRCYVGGVDFYTLPTYLQNERSRLNQAQTEEAFAAAVQQSLQRFGISHVAIIPPAAAAMPQRTARIGIGASTRPASGGLRVMGLAKDSPAAGTGLRPGDIIVAVDGERPRTPEDLEGPADSVAVLSVRRLSGEVVEVRVPRRPVDMRTPATYRELSPRTALIQIPTFGPEYLPLEIEELIERAFKHENLIIDLRGNGGGHVSHLVHLLGLLLPEGTPLGTPVSNDLAARYVAAEGGDPSDAGAVAAWATEDRLTAGENVLGPYPGRVAVLIDGQSASASEVTSAALRECRGALIVGQKSAGALLVSSFEELPGGFKAQIPISDYITIKGARPEGEGVAPDIEVDGPRGEAAVRVAQQALEAPPKAPR